jgi:predicted TIM-barrel fold metal-dependent hydrolase
VSANDLTLISSDSHAKISHDKVKAHLASKYHEAYDTAVAEYAASMARGAGAINQSWMKSDRRVEEKKDSFRLRNMERPGHSDGKARLEDMDTDGVAQEVIYCEVSGFRYLYQVKDASYEATMAFNDAMHEYGSADPNRLIVSYQIPIHDIDMAVREVKRVASLGGKSLQLPVFPPEVGLADYYHERYDPLWQIISETGLPICCHIGLNTQLSDLVHRDPTPGGTVYIPMVALSTAEALGMWIMTGILERYPKLNVVFVEPGLGWISWYLYIVDDMVTRQGYETPFIKELPSYYWHRNMFATFIDEPDALKSEEMRYRLGPESIMWSSDYPHPVTSWPNSRTLVNEQFKGLPDEEVEMMVYSNAKKVWNL